MVNGIGKRRSKRGKSAWLHGGGRVNKCGSGEMWVAQQWAQWGGKTTRRRQDAQMQALVWDIFVHGVE
jgi:hypothetical protein